MSFFVRNVSVIAVWLILASFAWVWGGTRGDLLLSFVPWLVLFLVEMCMTFPQRMPYESIDEARLRVWRGISGDRLTWLVAGFIVLLAIPFANTSIRALPWCVNRMAHLNVFLWFCPSLLALVAARHALRRHGKRLLAEMLVWNGVALAALGFVQLFSGASAPYWSEGAGGRMFFSTFGYPNMAGDYFTSLALIAIGLWRRRLEDMSKLDPHRQEATGIFWRRHYHLIAAAILYFAALNTLSRAAIILSTAGVVALFVFAGLSRVKKLRRVERVKFSATLVVSVIGIALFGLMFTPDSVRKEIDTINADGVLTRVTGKGEYHTRVATELLSDYPAFGCGGWGYMYLCSEKLPESVTKGFRDPWCKGAANVHNDYMQFLCEHGLLGFGLLMAIVVFTMLPAVTCWKRLAVVARFSHHTGLPWPKGFFCFPPAGIAIYAAALATLIHAFGDCPLRSPAVLSLFFVELALVDGFLPRGDKE